jgi:hypothetical protein
MSRSLAKVATSLACFAILLSGCRKQPRPKVELPIAGRLRLGGVTIVDWLCLILFDFADHLARAGAVGFKAMYGIDCSGIEKRRNRKALGVDSYSCHPATR